MIILHQIVQNTLMRKIFVMIQKKIADFLFSTRLMAVLFVALAVAMAVGTFIEDAYSTAFARIYVYNTKWFELIMILLALNFLGNIAKYKLWRKEKWLTLLLHLSFILIIIGAGITRYISFEGVMPIENGESADSFYSQKTFLSTYIDGEDNGQMLRKKEDFNVLLAEGANNHHTFTTDFKGQEVEFEIEKFIEGAKRTVVEDPDGKKYLKLVEAGSGQRRDHFLVEGQVSDLNNILIAYNNDTDGAININVDEEGNYTIHSPFPGEYMRMADQKKGELLADSTQKLQLRSLYTIGGMGFVFPEKVIRGHYDITKDESQQDQEETDIDGLVVKVRANGEEKKINLLGSMGRVSNFKDIELGDLDIHLRYGSKEHQLPFSVHLDEFIAEKYPGTANNPTPSYSSFKSKVTVEDEGEKSKYEIYMNHILDYKGFRFFQSSFLPGEKGTVLSVNHDTWGTNITYLGYTLLYIGMVLILFIKGSRFKELEKKLRNLKKSKDKKRAKITGVIAILLLLGSFTGYSQSRKEDIPGYNQPPATQQTIEQEKDTLSQGEQIESTRRSNPIIGQDLSKKEIDSIIKANAAPKDQAEKFGSLVIQDNQGRMKPVNTYSSELLRKLGKSDSYAGLNSDQFLISITQNPLIWYNVPLIKIKKQDDSLRNILGISDHQKGIKLIQFFDQAGRYKFEPYLEDAYRAKIKSQFQKDLVDADGKVNLFYNALQGDLLRIFPIPDDVDNKWISYPEVLEQKDKFSGKDSLFVSNALPLYMQGLFSGNKNGDYSQANQILNGMKKFQEKFGAQIMPSAQHIQAEIFYNKYDIFQNLFWLYLLAGTFLFLFVIIAIFYPKRWIHHVITFGKVVTILLFALHTITLIVRWYISGHAPWSDAYESMIYVGWATMLFGLIFGRKSDLTIASTAFVTAMILMIAHWNWMDPSIENLEPVLDSYWLMIHTSVIVGSYGPFTLGFILGIVSLLLIICTNKKNKKKMKINIKELTIITEMTLTVGLVMLTIGNFLGGQWANESWGRYWGWDPKETWALISIMVYAFVIHMRLVPGLRSRFAFNWVTVLAYGSILMTYFGVNFYLSGMHSYASGDQIISYQFIGIALVIWILLGILSYRKYKRFYKRGAPEKINA